MSVFRSLRYVYVQLIDDEAARTLCAASTLEPAIRERLRKEGKSTKGAEAARLLGTTIAERARAKGIEKVVFDRGGYKYHGRIKALADAARQAGLNF